MVFRDDAISASGTSGIFDQAFVKSSRPLQTESITISVAFVRCGSAGAVCGNRFATARFKALRASATSSSASTTPAGIFLTARLSARMALALETTSVPKVCAATASTLGI
jgi:hypothetical protein